MLMRMTSQPLQRSFLRFAIVFLALTAAVALVSVLTGTMGELQGRVLATSTTISLGCVTAMACAAYRERGRHPRLADFGIGCAGVAAVMMIFGIWANISPTTWRFVFCTMIWAFACAHGQLLCLPQLQREHRWTQNVVVAAITVLSSIGSVAILFEYESEWLGRVLIAIAIVVALFTLVVPILAKLRKGESTTTGSTAALPEQLVLARGIDGVFRDAQGLSYHVARIG